MPGAPADSKGPVLLAAIVTCTLYYDQYFNPSQTVCMSEV